MTKPPAFQFYASDFLASTVDMTASEVGGYVRLLCSSWDRGPLPKDEGKLARTMQVTPEEFSAIWPAVRERLTETSKGYINKRLEVERKKQADYREKQANKGRASAQQRFNRSSTAVQPEHQPEPSRAPSQRLEPEGNSPSPSPSPSPIEPAKDAGSNARAVGEPPPSWREPGPRHSTNVQPRRAHAGCYQSAAACAKGLCIPLFLGQQWEFQAANLPGDESGPAYVAAFIAGVLKFTPSVPQGDPLPWWRQQWDVKHRVPVASTKGARTIAAGNRLQEKLDAGATLDPFGTNDYHEQQRQLAAKAGA